MDLLRQSLRHQAARLQLLRARHLRVLVGAVEWASLVPGRIDGTNRALSGSKKAGSDRRLERLKP